MYIFSILIEYWLKIAFHLNYSLFSERQLVFECKIFRAHSNVKHFKSATKIFSPSICYSHNDNTKDNWILIKRHCINWFNHSMTRRGTESEWKILKENFFWQEKRDAERKIEATTIYRWRCATCGWERREKNSHENCLTWKFQNEKSLKTFFASKNVRCHFKLTCDMRLKLMQLVQRGKFDGSNWWMILADRRVYGDGVLFVMVKKFGYWNSRLVSLGARGISTVTQENRLLKVEIQKI